jgi:hypothetical protein
MKLRQATIGPTVWLLEGPMPTLKSSKVEVVTGRAVPVEVNSSEIAWLQPWQPLQREAGGRASAPGSVDKASLLSSPKLPRLTSRESCSGEAVVEDAGTART